MTSADLIARARAWRTGDPIEASREGNERMPAEAKQMDFKEFASQLQSVFDTMERENVPVLVERDGYLYRVEPQGRTDDIWSSYDPERVREALAQSAGALAGIDREELLADIRAQRGQDSQGRPAQ
jgi:hypothetical protein